MNWRLQTTLAGILAALGLWIIFNPVTLVTAAASVIPWLLLAAGAVQALSIVFRRRRVFSVVIFPAVTGALFIYAALSMKYGDPRTVGPISLIFVLALVFFGSGAAKLVTSFSMRQSRYFLYLIGSGAVSLIMGLIVLFNWDGFPPAWIGIFLGIEAIADAVVMAVLGLRERDGEAAMEALGLDPAAEAAKADSKREANAAATAVEAAEIKAATQVAEARAAQIAAEAQAIADTRTLAADARPAVTSVPTPAPLPGPTTNAPLTPPVVDGSLTQVPIVAGRPAAGKPASSKAIVAEPPSTEHDTLA